MNRRQRKKRKQISAYQQEIRKLQDRIKRAENKGFVFDNLKIPRITKGVKKLRGNLLRAKADYYVDQETGELLKPLEGVRKQNKLAQYHRKLNKEVGSRRMPVKKRYAPNYDEDLYSNTVINHWYATLEVNRNGKGHHLLSVWASDMIRQYGRSGFANILTQGASNGTVLSRAVAYNEALTQQYIAEMSAYMPEYSFIELSEALEEEDGWETGEFPE